MDTDPTGFFGDMSNWEIVTSLLAVFATALSLFMAVWVFIVERFRGADIRAVPGDTIGLVYSAGYASFKFHILLSLANHGARVGTVQHIQLRVRNPSGTIRDFAWKQFFRYSDSLLNAEPDSPTYPFAIAPKATEVRFLEFELSGPDSMPWEPGTYFLELRVWADKKSLAKHPSSTHSFEVDFVNEVAELAGRGLSPAARAQVETLPIKGWERKSWPMHQLNYPVG